MREIIFRGKSRYSGKWVEGYFSMEVGKIPYIQWLEYDDAYDEEVVEECAVELETVGEYTGMKDKSGNKNKIFEGDIVDVDNALVSGRFWVEYGVSGAFIVKDKDDRRYFLGGCNCTVIGNIHDNPELLEGGIT